MDDYTARGYTYAVAWLREGLAQRKHLVHGDVQTHQERRHVEMAILDVIADLEVRERRLRCTHRWEEHEEVDVDSRSVTTWMECTQCGAQKATDAE